MTKHKIWDLTPEGGGRPVLMEMHSVDASEAIARNPERYTRFAPEGTVEHELDQRRVARNEELRKIAASENEALGKIAADRRAAIDAIKHEQHEATVAETERLRKEREEKEGVPAVSDRKGEIDQINQKAAQAQARVRIEHDEKRAEILNKPAEPIDAKPPEEINPSEPVKTEPEQSEYFSGDQS